MMIAAKFRAKPVEVEALVYDGTFESCWQLISWADSHNPGYVTPFRWREDPPHGSMAFNGDRQEAGTWFVRDIDGEYRAFEESEFTARYEPQHARITTSGPCTP